MQYFYFKTPELWLQLYASYSELSGISCNLNSLKLWLQLLQCNKVQTSCAPPALLQVSKLDQSIKAPGSPSLSHVHSFGTRAGETWHIHSCPAPSWLWGSSWPLSARCCRCPRLRRSASRSRKSPERGTCARSKAQS